MALIGLAALSGRLGTDAFAISTVSGIAARAPLDPDPVPAPAPLSGRGYHDRRLFEPASAPRAIIPAPRPILPAPRPGIPPAPRPLLPEPPKPANPEIIPETPLTPGPVDAGPLEHIAPARPVNPGDSAPSIPDPVEITDISEAFATDDDTSESVQANEGCLAKRDGVPSVIAAAFNKRAPSDRPHPIETWDGGKHPHTSRVDFTLTSRQCFQLSMRL